MFRRKDSKRDSASDLSRRKDDSSRSVRGTDSVVSGSSSRRDRDDDCERHRRHHKSSRDDRSSRADYSPPESTVSSRRRKSSPTSSSRRGASPTRSKRDHKSSRSVADSSLGRSDSGSKRASDRTSSSRAIETFDTSERSQRSNGKRRALTRDGEDDEEAQMAGASTTNAHNPQQYHDPQHPDLSQLQSNVPNQFPDQTPLYYSTPYLPTSNPHGEAADYYGDQGQSVQHQPGVRPATPIVIGAEPHLLPASAEPAPPEETGQGAAAEFFASGGDLDAATSSSLPVQNMQVVSPRISPAASPQPARPNRPNKYFGKLSSSSALGAATAAAVGTAALSHHHSSNSHDYSSTHVSSTSRPPRPSTHSHSRPPQTSGKPYLPHHHSSYQHEQYAMENGDKGAFQSFMDWWNDYEDVRKMEEYTEYIGVCKYCFDRNSGPWQAPRVHNPRRVRSRESFENLRVDKQRRYQGSTADRPSKHQKRNATWLGAGLGAYGVAKFFGAGSDSESSSDSSKRRRRYASESVVRRDSHGRASAVTSQTSKPHLGRTQSDQVTAFSNQSSHSLSRNERDTALLATGAAGAIGAAAAFGGNHDARRGRHEASREKRIVPDGSVRKTFDDGRHRPLSSIEEHAPGHEKVRIHDRKERRKRTSSPSSSSSSSASRSDRETGFFGRVFGTPKKGSAKRSRRRSSERRHRRGSANSDEQLVYDDQSPTRAKRNGKGKERAGNRPRRSSDERAKIALAGLGTAAAALAAHEAGKNRNGLKNGKDSSHSGLAPPPKRQQQLHQQEEDGWESASEDQESDDSALAFGASHLGLHKSANSSAESVSSSSSGSGTQKWDWRWGPKRRRSPPRREPSQIDPLVAAAPLAAGAAGVAIDHSLSRPTEHTLRRASTEPLRVLDPLPDDETSSRRIQAGQDTTPSPKPLVRSRTDDIPLRQPQPIQPAQIPPEPSEAPSFTRRVSFADAPWKPKRTTEAPSDLPTPYREYPPSRPGDAPEDSRKHAPQHPRKSPLPSPQPGHWISDEEDAGSSGPDADDQRPDAVSPPSSRFSTKDAAAAGIAAGAVGAAISAGTKYRQRADSDEVGPLDDTPAYVNKSVNGQPNRQSRPPPPIVQPSQEVPRDLPSSSPLPVVKTTPAAKQPISSKPPPTMVDPAVEPTHRYDTRPPPAIVADAKESPAEDAVTPFPTMHVDADARSESDDEESRRGRSRSEVSPPRTGSLPTSSSFEVRRPNRGSESSVDSDRSYFDPDFFKNRRNDKETSDLYADSVNKYKQQTVSQSDFWAPDELREDRTGPNDNAAKTSRGEENFEEFFGDRTGQHKQLDGVPRLNFIPPTPPGSVAPASFRSRTPSPSRFAREAQQSKKASDEDESVDREIPVDSGKDERRTDANRRRQDDASTHYDPQHEAVKGDSTRESYDPPARRSENNDGEKAERKSRRQGPSALRNFYQQPTVQSASDVDLSRRQQPVASDAVDLDLERDSEVNGQAEEKPSLADTREAKPPSSEPSTRKPKKSGKAESRWASLAALASGAAAGISGRSGKASETASEEQDDARFERTVDPASGVEPETEVEKPKRKSVSFDEQPSFRERSPEPFSQFSTERDRTEDRHESMPGAFDDNDEQSRDGDKSTTSTKSAAADANAENGWATPTKKSKKQKKRDKRVSWEAEDQVYYPPASSRSEPHQPVDRSKEDLKDDLSRRSSDAPEPEAHATDDQAVSQPVMAQPEDEWDMQPSKKSKKGKKQKRQSMTFDSDEPAASGEAEADIVQSKRPEARDELQSTSQSTATATNGDRDNDDEVALSSGLSKKERKKQKQNAQKLQWEEEPPTNAGQDEGDSTGFESRSEVYETGEGSQEKADKVNLTHPWRAEDDLFDSSNLPMKQAVAVENHPIPERNREPFLENFDGKNFPFDERSITGPNTSVIVPAAFPTFTSIPSVDQEKPRESECEPENATGLQIKGLDMDSIAQDSPPRSEDQKSKRRDISNFGEGVGPFEPGDLPFFGTPPADSQSPRERVVSLKESTVDSGTPTTPQTPQTRRQTSSTAIPLRFRKPPGSPSVGKESQPHTPSAETTDSPTTPGRQRQGRPTSTEFKNGTNEFRPLYLVERNSKTPEPQETLPSLPSSNSDSRAPSVHESSDNDAYESALESPNAPPSVQSDYFVPQIRTGFEQPPIPDEYLGSGQTTPRANTASPVDSHKPSDYFDAQIHEYSYSSMPQDQVSGVERTSKHGHSESSASAATVVAGAAAALGGAALAAQSHRDKQEQAARDDASAAPATQEREPELIDQLDLAEKGQPDVDGEQRPDYLLEDDGKSIETEESFSRPKSKQERKREKKARKSKSKASNATDNESTFERQQPEQDLGKSRNLDTPDDAEPSTAIRENFPLHITSDGGVADEVDESLNLAVSTTLPDTDDKDLSEPTPEADNSTIAVPSVSNEGKDDHATSEQPSSDARDVIDQTRDEETFDATSSFHPSKKSKKEKRKAKKGFAGSSDAPFDGEPDETQNRSERDIDQSEAAQAEESFGRPKPLTETSTTAPEAEEDDPFMFSSSSSKKSKKDKKKAKKAASTATWDDPSDRNIATNVDPEVQISSEPPASDEPAPPPTTTNVEASLGTAEANDEDLFSVSTKKSKKEKRKSKQARQSTAYEEQEDNSRTANDEAAAGLVIPKEDEAESNFDDQTKLEETDTIQEPSVSVPEQGIQDDEWASFTPSKQSKKAKRKSKGGAPDVNEPVSLGESKVDNADVSKPSDQFKIDDRRRSLDVGKSDLAAPTVSSADSQGEIVALQEQDQTAHEALDNSAAQLHDAPSQPPDDFSVPSSKRSKGEKLKAKKSREASFGDDLQDSSRDVDVQPNSNERKETQAERADSSSVLPWAAAAGVGAVAANAIAHEHDDHSSARDEDGAQDPEPPYPEGDNFEDAESSWPVRTSNDPNVEVQRAPEASTTEQEASSKQDDFQHAIIAGLKEAGFDTNLSAASGGLQTADDDDAKSQTEFVDAQEGEQSQQTPAQDGNVFAQDDEWLATTPMTKKQKKAAQKRRKLGLTSDDQPIERSQSVEHDDDHFAAGSTEAAEGDNAIAQAVRSMDSIASQESDSLPSAVPLPVSNEDEESFFQPEQQPFEQESNSELAHEEDVQKDTQTPPSNNEAPQADSEQQAPEDEGAPALSKKDKKKQAKKQRQKSRALEDDESAARDASDVNQTTEPAAEALDKLDDQAQSSTLQNEPVAEEPFYTSKKDKKKAKKQRREDQANTGAREHSVTDASDQGPSAVADPPENVDLASHTDEPSRELPTEEPQPAATESATHASGIPDEEWDFPTLSKKDKKKAKKKRQSVLAADEEPKVQEDMTNDEQARSQALEDTQPEEAQPPSAFSNSFEQAASSDATPQAPSNDAEPPAMEDEWASLKSRKKQEKKDAKKKRQSVTFEEPQDTSEAITKDARAASAPAEESHEFAAPAEEQSQPDNAETIHHSEPDQSKDPLDLSSEAQPSALDASNLAGPDNEEQNDLEDWAPTSKKAKKAAKKAEKKRRQSGQFADEEENATQQDTEQGPKITAPAQDEQDAKPSISDADVQTADAPRATSRADNALSNETPAIEESNDWQTTTHEPHVPGSWDDEPEQERSEDLKETDEFDRILAASIGDAGFDSNKLLQADKKDLDEMEQNREPALEFGNKTDSSKSAERSGTPSPTQLWAKASPPSRSPPNESAEQPQVEPSSRGQPVEESDGAGADVKDNEGSQAIEHAAAAAGLAAAAIGGTALLRSNSSKSSKKDKKKKKKGVSFDPWEDEAGAESQQQPDLGPVEPQTERSNPMDDLDEQRDAPEQSVKQGEGDTVPNEPVEAANNAEPTLQSSGPPVEPDDEWAPAAMSKKAKKNKKNKRASASFDDAHGGDNAQFQEVQSETAQDNDHSSHDTEMQDAGQLVEASNDQIATNAGASAAPEPATVLEEPQTDLQPSDQADETFKAETQDLENDDADDWFSSFSSKKSKKGKKGKRAQTVDETERPTAPPSAEDVDMGEAVATTLPPDSVESRHTPDLGYDTSMPDAQAADEKVAPSGRDKNARFEDPDQFTRNENELEAAASAPGIEEPSEAAMDDDPFASVPTRKLSKKEQKKQKKKEEAAARAAEVPLNTQVEESSPADEEGKDEQQMDRDVAVSRPSSPQRNAVEPVDEGSGQATPAQMEDDDFWAPTKKLSKKEQKKQKKRQQTLESEAPQFESISDAQTASMPMEDVVQQDKDSREMADAEGIAEQDLPMDQATGEANPEVQNLYQDHASAQAQDGVAPARDDSPDLSSTPTRKLSKKEQKKQKKRQQATESSVEPEGAFQGEESAAMPTERAINEDARAQQMLDGEGDAEAAQPSGEAMQFDQDPGPTEENKPASENGDDFATPTRKLSKKEQKKQKKRQQAQEDSFDPQEPLSQETEMLAQTSDVPEEREQIAVTEDNDPSVTAQEHPAQDDWDSFFDATPKLSKKEQKKLKKQQQAVAFDEPNKAHADQPATDADAEQRNLDVVDTSAFEQQERDAEEGHAMQMGQQQPEQAEDDYFPVPTRKLSKKEQKKLKKQQQQAEEFAEPSETQVRGSSPQPQTNKAEQVPDDTRHFEDMERDAEEGHAMDTTEAQPARAEDDSFVPSRKLSKKEQKKLKKQQQAAGLDSFEKPDDTQQVNEPGTFDGQNLPDDAVTREFEDGERAEEEGKAKDFEPEALQQDDDAFFAPSRKLSKKEQKKLKKQQQAADLDSADAPADIEQAGSKGQSSAMDVDRDQTTRNFEDVERAEEEGHAKDIAPDTQEQIDDPFSMPSRKLSKKEQKKLKKQQQASDWDFDEPQPPADQDAQRTMGGAGRDEFPSSTTEQVERAEEEGRATDEVSGPAAGVAGIAAAAAAAITDTNEFSTPSRKLSKKEQKKLKKQQQADDWNLDEPQQPTHQDAPTTTGKPEEELGDDFSAKAAEPIEGTGDEGRAIDDMPEQIASVDDDDDFATPSRKLSKKEQKKLKRKQEQAAANTFKDEQQAPTEADHITGPLDQPMDDEVNSRDAPSFVPMDDIQEPVQAERPNENAAEPESAPQEPVQEDDSFSTPSRKLSKKDKKKAKKQQQAFFDEPAFEEDQPDTVENREAGLTTNDPMQQSEKQEESLEEPRPTINTAPGDAPTPGQTNEAAGQEDDDFTPSRKVSKKDKKKQRKRQLTFEEPEETATPDPMTVDKAGKDNSPTRDNDGISRDVEDEPQDQAAPPESTTKSRESSLFVSPPSQRVLSQSLDNGVAPGQEALEDDASTPTHPRHLHHLHRAESPRTLGLLPNDRTPENESSRSLGLLPNDRTPDVEHDQSPLSVRRRRSRPLEVITEGSREPSPAKRAHRRHDEETRSNDGAVEQDVPSPGLLTEKALRNRRGSNDLRRASMSPSGSELANVRRAYIRSPGSATYTTASGDIVRASSPLSNHSRAGSTASNHSLRRVDDKAISRSISSDLRAANKRDAGSSEKARAPSDGKAPLPSPAPLPSEYEPLKGPGVKGTKDRRQDMSDGVYEAFGDARGSAPSPTRPPSVRKRQSLQVLDLQNRLDEALAENESLKTARTRSERGLDDSNLNTNLQKTLQARDVQIGEKDVEIRNVKTVLATLQGEVHRLTERNTELQDANDNLGADVNRRYAALQSERDEAHGKWQESSRQLDELQRKHGKLSAGMEAIVRQEIAAALDDRNAEIKSLRAELETASNRIETLQKQAASRGGGKEDFLNMRDEEYFDEACQQLCTAVQQWVLRFSKYSDNRKCRLSADVKDEAIETRLDNAMLDGTDVDDYLADRVLRRDVFMSVVMTMIWEYVFTRYLFGMDREQRSKLKSLEKTLSEVGPPRAVAQWRATTLSLLSRREAFFDQRSQDTDAVVYEIFKTLARLLPPPGHQAKQVQEQLRNVLSLAVDLSIEMRTQRAEYIMLPPLRPEFDTNGELAKKVFFNATLMNEKSGETASNEELEEQSTTVRVVLFPLVVKRGNDYGETDDEIVVHPAQVLVSRPNKRRSGVMSGAKRSSVSIAPPPSAGGDSEKDEGPEDPADMV